MLVCDTFSKLEITDTWGESTHNNWTLYIVQSVLAPILVLDPTLDRYPFNVTPTGKMISKRGYKSGAEILNKRG